VLINHLVMVLLGEGGYRNEYDRNVTDHIFVS
jgi:hypothetical protein